MSDTDRGAEQHGSAAVQHDATRAPDGHAADHPEEEADTRPPHQTIAGFVLAFWISLGIWLTILAGYFVLR